MTANAAQDQSTASERDETVLQLEGISVRFGGIVALADVSFDAKVGEVLGIIGPNGAGKTTLFDVISGVRSPNEGRVVLGGIDLTGKSASERARRGLRRTFQRVQTFGWLTVEDNVLTALEWRGGGGGFVADLVYAPTRRHRDARGESASMRSSNAAGSSRCARSLPDHCRSVWRGWWSSHERLSILPRCCCSTNPRPVSTRPRSSASANRSRRCEQRPAASYCSSNTTPASSWNRATELWCSISVPCSPLASPMRYSATRLSAMLISAKARSTSTVGPDRDTTRPIGKR